MSGYIVLTGAVYAVWAGIAATIAGVTAVALGPGLELWAFAIVGLVSPVFGIGMAWLVDFVAEHVVHRDLPDGPIFAFYFAAPAILAYAAISLR